MTRLLIVGSGRMGSLVRQLAPAHGFDVVGVLGRADAAAGLEALAPRAADVAIDFTLAEAVPANLPRLAARGINVVVGTTGWQAHEAALREEAGRRGIGVVASANFSPGMSLFRHVAAEAARRLAARPEFGAFIHERHHDKKRERRPAPRWPSRRRWSPPASRFIDVSSTRAGFIPGTHSVGFDGPAETIELTHTVRDRSVFAHGALVAAKWVVGGGVVRRGRHRQLTSGDW